MTPEAQRIAIAKVCGWTKINYNPLDGYFGKEANGIPDGCKVSKPLPDYLNDLNAMHEAEWKMLKVTERLTCYEDILMDIINKDGTDCIRGVFRAKAAQRAEAFLKTLDLWKD